MIPHFLPNLLHKASILEHKCVLVNNKLVEYKYRVSEPKQGEDQS